jgi:hypothetical protein
MKKVLVATLALAFCVPASADLVVYKISSREAVARYSDPNNCLKVKLSETMWVILDVNEPNLAALECDRRDLGDDDIMDGAVFKTFKAGRDRFYGSELWPGNFSLVAYILNEQATLRIGICYVECVMEGKIGRRDILPRSLAGYCTIAGGGTVGEGSCRARLDTSLARIIEEEGYITVAEVLAYLESIQPDDATEIDICDPFSVL